MFVSGPAASRPGMLGIAACVPRFRKTRSPASTRVPPSFKRTSSVFGATKFPTPIINSAPLALLTDFGHVGRDGARLRAEACGVMHQVGDFCAPDLVVASENFVHLTRGQQRIR